MKYLLRDDFSGTRAAGSVHGTPATLGPGTRYVTDTGSKLSVTGGKAVSAARTGAADPLFGYSDPIARVPGRTFKWITNYVANRGHAGIGSAIPSTIPRYGFFEASGLITVIQPAHIGYIVGTTGVDYTMWITVFAAGAAIWVQGGAYTNPTLVWVTSRYNHDPLYLIPQIATAVNCQMQTSQVEVVDVPSRTSRASIATVNQAAPENGVNYVTSANALHYLEYTLPAEPEAGDIIELRYRYQDTSNYWTAYIERNGDNDNWDFKLDEVLTAGTTNKVAVNDIGNSDAICVVCAGNEHWAFTASNFYYLLRGSKITDASLATATEVGAWYDAGTMGKLDSFDREWSL